MSLARWQHEMAIETNSLLARRADFPAVYMAVSNLQYLIRKHPDAATEQTIEALLGVLESKDHRTQRQVYFLFRKAANAIGLVMEHASESVMVKMAREALIHLLDATNGYAYQAAAEALGSIPLNIRGPHIKTDPIGSIPTLTWSALLDRARFQNHTPPEWKGRNVVLSSPDGRRLLVVKMARPGERLELLNAEGRWMVMMRELAGQLPLDGSAFHVPVPLSVDSGFLFRLQGEAPLPVPPELSMDTGMFGMAFITHPDYFCYPNMKKADGHLPQAHFLEILSKNAWLLGHLAARGIIHEAPIPLFHNRVQRERRTDRGLYEWRRGGRLDRWLSSCDYPNIGKSGIRDFEHFISFAGSPRKLYELIGTHVFSLVLVAGSYFRNRDPNRVGFSETGQPVDVRMLFDPSLLEKAVKEIYTNYYKGFTGIDRSIRLPMNLQRFTDRLIEEMGVDRYMEEILRATDQANMNDADFAAFLMRRGYAAHVIARLEKGRKDIILFTGPHLGGFNQRISLPELVDFTAAVAALCVADRHCRAKGIDAYFEGQA